METKQKSKVVISIERIKGETFLNFTISPEIEAIWQAKSQEIKESEKWQGLKFYYCPEIIEGDTYADLLYSNNLIDDYGHTLFDNHKFNIRFYSNSWRYGQG